MAKTTPVRKQYLDIKKQHPDKILFFRLGDFYETFDEDAEITSRELDIVLTTRKVSKSQRVPMAGIPYHAIENYLGRLISKGYHVAICEQVGIQPQKGLFPREVVRVITPGTVVEPGLINPDENNYLVSIYIENQNIGIAYLDVTTGSLNATEFFDTETHQRLFAEISRLNPAEILIPEGLKLSSISSNRITKLKNWKFDYSRGESLLIQQLRVKVLDGYGLKNMNVAVSAIGGLLNYLKETNPSKVNYFNSFLFYSLENYMILDQATRINLELVTSNVRSGTDVSLLNTIDRSVTPMGKRLIKQWINRPLIDKKEIKKRADAVEIFFNNGLLRAELQELLKNISDIERIIRRIDLGYVQPKEIVSLRSTLSLIPNLLSLVKPFIATINVDNYSISDCGMEYQLLKKAISEEPPATLQNIGVIKHGYSQELDQLNHSTKSARTWIAGFEQNEKKRLGIKTLKVGYNKVFGYYIEISKSQTQHAPPEYIRKQTLVNAERYITSELKEYETIILNADEQIKKMENDLFQEICFELSKSQNKLNHVANFIAVLDVILSFAEVAVNNRYVRPDLVDDVVFEIKDGRHPVVEKSNKIQSFVPNNVFLTENEKIQIITGPNMSGKSTYLRQVALIVLLAQIGSFVPAASAKIGLVDRIFTRIGSQDEIHAGQSTFMVEMVETANILHHATNKSLLILDEIGRGTSTYDGLAIAWAVIEYIHNHPSLKSRTFFATHYHELINLSEYLPLVGNLNVAVSESNEGVVFLHKIIPGGSDKSYGIHVAQLAGIPNLIINRAADLLSTFEKDAIKVTGKSISDQPIQPLLFNPYRPLINEIDEIDLNSISPIEALNLIYKWKKEYKNKK